MTCSVTNTEDEHSPALLVYTIDDAIDVRLVSEKIWR